MISSKLSAREKYVLMVIILSLGVLLGMATATNAGSGDKAQLLLESIVKIIKMRKCQGIAGRQADTFACQRIDPVV